MIDLELQLKAAKLPSPEKEYKFHPDRRWRFDFAWRDKMVALEREGNHWQGKSRHSVGVGFRNDCIKYSEAAILGWRVIRVTVDMVADGTALNLIERALNV